MQKPITEQELEAEEMLLDDTLINESNCAEHYRTDVLAMRRRLKKYESNKQTYALLLDEFVVVLTDKYWKFIEDMQDDMPENDLEIYADLEGREYEPDEN